LIDNVCWTFAQRKNEIIIFRGLRDLIVDAFSYFSLLRQLIKLPIHFLSLNNDNVVSLLTERRYILFLFILF